MWQLLLNDKKVLLEDHEKVLSFLYENRWDGAKAMCMECGEVLETGDETDVFAFISRHDGHFGTLLDLADSCVFESLETIGGEEI